MLVIRVGYSGGGHYVSGGYGGHYGGGCYGGHQEAPLQTQMGPLGYQLRRGYQPPPIMQHPSHQLPSTYQQQQTNGRRQSQGEPMYQVGGGGSGALGTPLGAYGHYNGGYPGHGPPHHDSAWPGRGPYGPPFPPPPIVQYGDANGGYPGHGYPYGAQGGGGLGGLPPSSDGHAMPRGSSKRPGGGGGGGSSGGGDTRGDAYARGFYDAHAYARGYYDAQSAGGGGYGGGDSEGQLASRATPTPTPDPALRPRARRPRTSLVHLAPRLRCCCCYCYCYWVGGLGLRLWCYWFMCFVLVFVEGGGGGGGGTDAGESGGIVGGKGEGGGTATWASIGTYTDEAEFNMAFEKLKNKECGRGVGVKFTCQGSSYRARDKSYITNYKCAYYNHTMPKCPFSVRVIAKPSSWEIQVLNAHVDHKTCAVPAKRGLSLAQKNVLSPSTLGKTPHSAAVWVAKGGIKENDACTLTDRDKAQLTAFHKRLRREASGGGGDKKGTWGALARAIEKCTL